MCCEQTGCTSFGHIVAVGVGSDPGHAMERLDVKQVWTAIDRGDEFYTSDDRGNTASVEKFNCPCGKGSLRSKADATTANNLDNLRICRWKAA